MICISSIESDVYNKKKIQMFVVNMTFISSREVKKCIFHECLRHIHDKHLNILYILHSSQRDSESPDQTIQMFSGYFGPSQSAYVMRAIFASYTLGMLT